MPATPRRLDEMKLTGHLDRVPENVQFVVDDADEDDWLYPPNTFDYIHTRVLLGCFENFAEIIKKGFKYTKPGGWMESQVPSSPSTSILPFLAIHSNCCTIGDHEHCLLRRRYHETGLAVLRMDALGR